MILYILYIYSILHIYISLYIVIKYAKYYSNEKVLGEYRKILAGVWGGMKSGKTLQEMVIFDNLEFLSIF